MKEIGTSDTRDVLQWVLRCLFWSLVQDPFQLLAVLVAEFSANLSPGIVFRYREPPFPRSCCSSKSHWVTSWGLWNGCIQFNFSLCPVLLPLHQRCWCWGDSPTNFLHVYLLHPRDCFPDTLTQDKGTFLFIGNRSSYILLAQIYYVSFLQYYCIFTTLSIHTKGIC